MRSILKLRLLGAMICACCLLPALARADIKLPGIFGSNMVLQRNIKIPVWGWAAPGEQVTVTLDQQTATAKAGNDGRWMVKLNPMQAGGPYDLTVAGANTIKLTNVLIGEVWVCSGQSNMDFSTNGVKNAQAEIAEANYPQIRLYTVTKVISDAPLNNCGGSWAECSPRNVGGFTAVGYFFGRQLYKDLNVPIGLISTAWGGTPAESWTPAEMYAADPRLKPTLDARDKQLADFASAYYNTYGSTIKDWLAAAEKAKAAGIPIPVLQPTPLAGDPRSNSGMPTGLYNGMIYPLVPFAIAGAIWYQGESNAGNAMRYRTLFPAMIQGWRKAWGQGDFPFYFVQLANFMATKPDPSESGWAELREAQSLTLALPNTGMAVIIDIGEANDIHPKNKQDVGKRLALNALANTYGKKIEYCGPVFDKMTIEGNKAHLTFKHMGAGLTTPDGGPLTGFAIAGADKKFVWAQAEIVGNEIVVTSDKVTEPVAVRYAWADNPVCNLYNKEGIPASPFRTDVPPTPEK